MTELKSKEDVEALINKEGIEYVSVRFTDLIGVQQHFTVPASEFRWFLRSGLPGHQRVRHEAGPGR